MSILALYHRIGSGKRGLPLIVQSRAIWATAGIISAFTLAVILVSMPVSVVKHGLIFQAQTFSCLPVTAAWDVEQIPIVCIDGATFMHVQGGINVFTDVVLLLYPLPLLRLLKFNKRQRSKCPVVVEEHVTDLNSGADSHLLHRPHPRGSKHNATVRDCHERQRRADRYGVAEGRFKLVRLSRSAIPAWRLTAVGRGRGCPCGRRLKSTSGS